MSKKKILLLSDDLRMHSGIATVSKDVVLGTMHKYDWAQIGGAVKHPEAGKGFNISKDGQQGDGGGLISQGYVYIGEDPEALKSFDVTDTDGQRDFTTVKVFREDIEELL